MYKRQAVYCAGAVLSVIPYAAFVRFDVKKAFANASDKKGMFYLLNGLKAVSYPHLELSLKAKGLLSQMLSLPEDWDYTLKGLSLINRETVSYTHLAALGGDFLGGAAVAGRLHLHGIKSERQGPHEAVVCDEFPLLRQQRQHGFHVLLGAFNGNVLRVLAALIFRKLLFQKVCQGVVEAVRCV